MCHVAVVTVIHSKTTVQLAVSDIAKIKIQLYDIIIIYFTCYFLHSIYATVVLFP